ncbi:12-oxophytodienoate reductase, putative [Phytophthora infestans T30-4]|uniref:12-oxophytodienoate reductase, putative n=1 Tax=Phytophthora infestans (strain T30-4) TaxID=403677 RepID=D0MRG1_PHYIT|nr:12-oxophytodienoate reductase, putative [Phytophthora infestans T30-4]EEY58080.1 12-oxophytodienoate reductase, putative [Phytophthora infestans T30-4]|eukprot:XP_002909266.1 12-oxophytodienoate reductase, putative [Phytophthora infestans T30-4]
MSLTENYKLFTPLQMGNNLVIKNRIVLGPATRARINPASHAPNEMNAIYYEQRAGAGLIISEEQAAGWKEVVDRIHQKGSKIFVQLWHMGRQSHPLAMNADGESTGFERARALTLNEIPGVVEQYRKCAELAKKVGFDGAEVHAGSGYLIDQFLQSCTNERTDQYGGSFENRYRLLHEIVEAVKTVYPSDHIGVRVSPSSKYGGMGSVDSPEMFTYVFQRLSEHGLGYLAILDGFGFGYSDKSRLMTTLDAKMHFKGIVMANCSYTCDTAEGVIRSGAADLVSFVRGFMSNPDLVERFQNDWPLNDELEYEFYWDPSKGKEGYITPPSYQSGRPCPLKKLIIPHF